MKNLTKYYLLLLSICFSCTDRGGEGDVENYSVRINNSSSENLIIKGYNINNGLEFELTVNSMSVGGEIEYVSDVFDGYQNRADSIVITFPNNKGYICDLRQSNDNYCFSDKHLLIGDESYFNNINNNTFEFEITQDDFDNANDLP